MTRYFHDWEFVELGPGLPTIPLSVGIVCQDGRSLYRQFREGVPYAVRNEWVCANVLPHLEQPYWKIVEAKNVEGEVLHRTLDVDTRGDAFHHPVWTWYEDTDQWRKTLLKFMNPKKYGKPELWGYYADYDHVLFAQSFGKMIDLPKGFPMYTLDLKQWAVMLGDPQLPPLPGGREHHALDDALEIKYRFQYLQDIQRERNEVKD